MVKRKSVSLLFCHSTYVQSVPLSFHYCLYSQAISFLLCTDYSNTIANH